MSENTKIEWASHTFNPWIGCAKVHAGCQNCYAEAMAGRLGVTWGPDGTRRRTAESTWKQVERWNRAEEPFLSWSNHERPRVFPSLCDPFEDWHGTTENHRGDKIWKAWSTGVLWYSQDHPGPRWSQLTMDDLRHGFFALMDRCQNLDFLLLTKRPKNIRRMWKFLDGDTTRRIREWMADGESRDVSPLWRKNIWLIYSASDQQSLDAGLPHLLACRDLVPVIGLSLEPLVGPVDLRTAPGVPRIDFGMCRGSFPKLDWVIVGGESGPRARPCDVSWIRSIVSQCREAGVPCFVKQLGTCAMARKDSVAGRIKGDHPEAEWPVGTRFGSWNLSHVGTEWQGRHVRLEDPKGGDPDEWPEDLRVREFPKQKVSAT